MPATGSPAFTRAAAVAVALGAVHTAPGQVGTPPPFLCGRAYSFGCSGDLTACAGADGMLTLQTLHFFNQIGSGCSPGPYNVTITATLPCEGGPSGAPMNFGPFTITEGYTQVALNVPVPAGMARECTLELTSRLNAPQDGSLYEQRADYSVYIVDPAPGTMLSPLSLSFDGPGIVRSHPGDPGAVTVVLTNNHPTETIAGTLTVTSRNYSDEPFVITGADDSRRGPYAPSDTQGDAPPVACTPPRPPEELCRSLPDPAPAAGQTTDARSVVLAPGESVSSSVAARFGALSARGSAADLCLHFDGAPTRSGAPFIAKANAVVAADHAQTPAFVCPGGGRAMTGFATTVAGVGPAAGFLGSARPDNGQQFRVNFALEIAGFEMFINGIPIASGNPNFSGITQVDGQHIRLTSEYSFITPLAAPNASITMIVPIVVRVHPNSAAQFQTELRSLDLLPGVPTGLDDRYPAAAGRVEANSIGSLRDAAVDFIHQMSAVGIEQGTFNPRDMTLTGWTLSAIGPGRYEVQSTWTATNPGATPFIGFDVFNDFRGFAAPGDIDGDRIANEDDDCPFIFNPAQGGGACDGIVTIDQVDFFATDGAPLAVRSDYGQFGVTLPNPGNAVVYVNAEIDGAWCVRNAPISGIDFPILHPFQEHFTMFAIGPRGEDATGQVRSVRTTATAAPLRFGVPTETPAHDVTVGGTARRVGDVDTIGDPPTPAAEGPADFTRPQGRRQVEVARRPGFTIVDLFQPGDEAACGPAAVANSMLWLNRTYCLGLPEESDDQATLRGLLAELGRRMNLDENGVSSAEIRRGKQAFIRAHRLPLRFEAQGLAAEDPSTPVDAAALFKQMQMGQDVEVVYRYGVGDERKGHAVSVIKMIKDGDHYTMVTVDDPRQDVMNAIDPETGQPRARREVWELTFIEGGPGGGFWSMRYGAESADLASWTAESPTKAATNRAVCEKAGDFHALLKGVGETADAAEAAEILRQALGLDFLARRLLEQVRCDDASSPEQFAAAENVVFAGIDVEEGANRVHERVGDIRQPGELDELRDAVPRLFAACDAFRAAYPPDADFDDIPDGEDNAPADANPDQADCNMNGIGDVAELAMNDCNDNAFPDDCDIRDGRSEDVNHDGIPDECRCPGDFNGDGGIDSGDFFDFLAAYFALDPRTDYTGDGEINSQDFFAFLEAFFAGCP